MAELLKSLFKNFRGWGGILSSSSFGKTLLTFQVQDSGHFLFCTNSVLHLHLVIGIGNNEFSSSCEPVVSSTSCPCDCLSGTQEHGFRIYP